MANKNYPKGIVKRGEEFDKRQQMKADVIEVLMSLLHKTTTEAFEKAGYSPIEKYAGVYGNEAKYGVGAEEEKFNIRLISKTNSYIDKRITLGAKAYSAEMQIDISKSGIVKIRYANTEQIFERGYIDPKGPYMIDEEFHIKFENKNQFSKEVKKYLENFAEREVKFITKTKIGVEDKINNGSESIVKESYKNMEKFTIKDIFLSGVEKLEEAKKKKEKEEKPEMNNPEVVKANTPDGLLFDGLDDIEEGEYKEYVKKTLKKHDMKDFDDLEWMVPSRKKAFFSDLEKWEELSEITSLGTAGGFQYQANAFVQTPYAQYKGSKKPSIKKQKESTEDSFWTKVDIEPLKKNHLAGALGMMGVEPGSKQEYEMSMTRNRYGKSGKVNESLDLTKRKFALLEENEKLGVNKRYIITEKLDSDSEKNKWKKLVQFETYETIKNAENVISESDKEYLNECGCQHDLEIDYVTRGEYEDEITHDFEEYNAEKMDSGDYVNGKKVVDVEKPNSLIIYKVFEDDFLNEGKRFIYDFKTKNYVLNPNFKN